MESHLRGVTPQIQISAGRQVCQFCKDIDELNSTLALSASCQVCDVPLCGQGLEASADFNNSESLCVGCTTDQCGTARLRQLDYNGTINTTKRGLTCQRWDSQVPHPHTESGPHLVENYCRNTESDGAGQAWCHTTDPNVGASLSFGLNGLFDLR